MTLTNFLFGIGLVAAAWFATSTILIYEAVRKRNVRVSFIFLRFLSISYASQYKRSLSVRLARPGLSFTTGLFPSTSSWHRPL